MMFRKLCSIRALVLAGSVGLMASSAWAQGASAGGPTVLSAPFGELALHPLRELGAVVVARNDSRLSAEVAGTVLRWGPDAGATVARGDLLVEIDPADLRLARDRARAALEAALSREAVAVQQMQRARVLVAQGFFSREALGAREADELSAQAERRSAELALAAAERTLAKTRISAPFDASVRQRLVQVGESVAPGTALYVLAETRGAELSVQASSEDALSLQRASESHFMLPDGSRIPLKLLRVAGTLSSPARTVELRLTAPGLVPGRDGRLVWRDPRPHVPAALLVRRDDTLGVFAVVDGQARFVPVPGAQEGRATPADLDPALRLVRQGQQALRHGQAVAP